MMAARPATSLRASARSSGRCTKLSATHSTPRSRPKRMSSRSFLVSGETSRITLGTLTPLWLDRVPPITTSVSACSLEHSRTLRRMRPSSINRSEPGLSAAKISGCGRGALRLSPGALSRSRRNGCPAFSSAEPPSIWPTRSLGPCRSSRMPTGRWNLRSNDRTMPWILAWSSCFPWEKFMRKTSTPASNSFSMASWLDVAGPRVATIFARRSRFMAGAFPLLHYVTVPAPIGLRPIADKLT